MLHPCQVDLAGVIGSLLNVADQIDGRCEQHTFSQTDNRSTERSKQD